MDDEKVYRVYVGKPSWKHIIIRKVDWQLNHWQNLKFYFEPHLTRNKNWFVNINFFFIGINKCNGFMGFRVLNWQLEICW